VSIEDGIRIGDPIRVTITGYAGDGFSGTSGSENAAEKFIRLDYGRESAYIACEQPGVTITKV